MKVVVQHWWSWKDAPEGLPPQGELELTIHDLNEIQQRFDVLICQSKEPKGVASRTLLCIDQQGGRFRQR